jgi:hypothetical protein
MNQKNYYNYNCSLYNTDKGQYIEAEVSYFEPGKVLRCTINETIEISLHFNSKHKEYVGSKAGLEFKSQGPKLLN